MAQGWKNLRLLEKVFRFLGFLGFYEKLRHRKNVLYTILHVTAV